MPHVKLRRTTVCQPVPDGSMPRPEMRLHGAAATCTSPATLRRVLAARLVRPTGRSRKSSRGAVPAERVLADDPGPQHAQQHRVAFRHRRRTAAVYRHRYLADPVQARIDGTGFRRKRLPPIERSRDHRFACRRSRTLVRQPQALPTVGIPDPERRNLIGGVQSRADASKFASRSKPARQASSVNA